MQRYFANERIQHFYRFLTSLNTILKSVLHGATSIGPFWAKPGQATPSEVYLESFESAFSTFPGVSHVAEHESEVRFAREGLDRVVLGRARPGLQGLAYLEIFDSGFLIFPGVSDVAEHESEVRFARDQVDRVALGQVRPPWRGLPRNFRFWVFDLPEGF